MLYAFFMSENFKRLKLFFANLFSYTRLSLSKAVLFDTIYNLTQRRDLTPTQDFSLLLSYCK